MAKDRELSAFQIKVYQAVKKIPRGQVRTYGWVARKIGQPKAARAVGQALNQNPFPVIIPCHRVVAKGGLGGYSGGIKKKIKLLRSEKYLC